MRFLFFQSAPQEDTVSDYRDEQVIAPFLLIRRVADRRALTSGTPPSESIGSIHLRSLGASTGDSGTVPGGDQMVSMGAQGETPDELGDRAETTIDGASL